MSESDRLTTLISITLPEPFRFTAAISVNKMQAKTMKAIKLVRSKSKQKVIAQRIFIFINKVVTVIASKQFQDLLGKVEKHGYTYKKGKSKEASFFIMKNILDSNERHSRGTGRGKLSRFSIKC